MTPTGLLAVIFGIWLAIGVGSAVVMGRRGYASFTWGVLGVTLGPLVIAVALAARRRRRSGETIVLTKPRVGMALLIGVDASQASGVAARHAVTVLQPYVGRVTVATVIPVDAMTHEHVTMVAAANATAQWITNRLSRSVGVVVLEGRPVNALAEFARAGGYDVIAVGTRGSGLSRFVLGSVATALPSAAEVPVLVCPTTVAHEPRRMSDVTTRSGRTPASG